MSEARLHTVFGLLFVLSFFGSDQLKRIVPSWYDPKVGLLSLVVAVLWLTRFFLARGRALADENKVLRDRVERLEHKVEALRDQADAP